MKNTNNLKSNIFNDLKYNSKSYISNLGLKTILIFILKIQILAKKDSKYKNSPTIRFENIYEFDHLFHFLKKQLITRAQLHPKFL